MRNGRPLSAIIRGVVISVPVYACALFAAMRQSLLVGSAPFYAQGSLLLVVLCSISLVLGIFALGFDRRLAKQAIFVALASLTLFAIFFPVFAQSKNRAASYSVASR
jgi:hypothetical protein